jgi:hypothetical protein
MSAMSGGTGWGLYRRFYTQTQVMDVIVVSRRGFRGPDTPIIRRRPVDAERQNMKSRG